ncbi:MAG: Maf family nucleotide pyrophosphatase [Paracoccaceae bacterium]|jgi:septum formation protein|nr:Maf family nucleotide pyrophosphatase [Paracoccaceae bacterium]
MPDQIILASTSKIRQTLLVNAGVDVDILPARIDEDAIKNALLADGASPRDIADALAEGKARKISLKNPDSLVIGCDQVLAHEKTILSKPSNEAEAKSQLKTLRGDKHQLLSAAVIYENGEPKWRHVGVARLTMRDFSDEYLSDYLTRNWESIRHSVGGYKLEEEGVRLFSRIDGDYFTILGIPLLELLSYLTIRGTLPK